LAESELEVVSDPPQGFDPAVGADFGVDGVACSGALAQTVAGFDEVFEEAGEVDALGGPCEIGLVGFVDRLVDGMVENLDDPSGLEMKPGLTCGLVKFVEYRIDFLNDRDERVARHPHLVKEIKS